MNGSVTPKVSRRSWLLGNGPLAMSSSMWFCQKQRASATPKTASETIRRARSSSRCSTRVRRSSCLTPFRRAIEGPLSALLGDYLALDGLHRFSVSLGLRLLQLAQLSVVIVVVAAHRALELTNSLAERTSQLRQALGPENDQGNDQDDQQLHWSDIGHHAEWYRQVAAGPAWTLASWARARRRGRS